MITYLIIYKDHTYLEVTTKGLKFFLTTHRAKDITSIIEVSSETRHKTADVTRTYITPKDIPSR
jgi:hypothetical protein